MRRLLSNKFTLIAFVAFCVLLPLNLIDGLVAERQQYHAEAIADMSASSTGAQRLVGPVLLLPCEEVYPSNSIGSGSVRAVSLTRDCTTYALPESLTLKGTMATDIRSRGIHDALFYSTQIVVEARFTLPESFAEEDPEHEIKLGQASLNVGVADTRGITNIPTLIANDAKVPFVPGSLPVLGGGLHAVIGDFVAAQSIDVKFTIQLRGLERLDIVPLGRQTKVSLKSSWPHPSFVGKYLPTKRDISADGFQAEWSTSHFSTNLDQLFSRHFRGNEAPDIMTNSFGVTLIDPVDLYTQSDRAVKYGFLFVILTFIALLGTELARNLRLHPAQYAMVGVALSMFFLLLLSLAEHIGFRGAYIVAALACVALLGYYVRHVVHSVSIGGSFAATLAMLYGLLYGLLASEDYALLTGSIFVFGILAALMVLTRNVNWYSVGALGAMPAPLADSTSMARPE